MLGQDCAQGASEGEAKSQKRDFAPC